MNQQDRDDDQETAALVARMRSLQLHQPSADLHSRIFAAPEPTRLEVGAWLTLTAASLFFCLTFRPAPSDLPKRLQVGDVLLEKRTPTFGDLKRHYEDLNKEARW